MSISMRLIGATENNQGIIRLSGALSGTASAPIVSELATKAAHLVRSEGAQWQVRPTAASGAMMWIDATAEGVLPPTATTADVITVATGLRYTRAK